MKIKLGKYKGENVFYDDDAAINGHIVTIGKTGCGKSVLNQNITLEIVKKSGSVLAISVNNTLKRSEVYAPIRDEFFSYAKEITAHSDGIFYPVFSGFTNANSEKQELDSILTLVDVFSQAYALKSRQISCLRKAITKVYENNQYKREGLNAIEKVLSLMDTPVSENLLDKLYPLFHYEIFKEGKNFLELHKINIIYLEGVDELTQRVASEMVLTFIWRMALYGEFKNNPLYIYIDEVQNFTIGKNSMLEKMLREGRKMGINLMVATQFLDNSTRFAKMLDQSDLQIYFQPTRNDFHSIAKFIDYEKIEDWICCLKLLEVGQFIAVGPLILNGIKTRNPLKVDAKGVYE